MSAHRRRPGWWLAAGVIVLCQAAAAPGFAQMGGLGSGQPGGTHMRGGSRNSANTPSSTAPAPLKSTPDPWPRLDPGAMLCGTEDALKQYQEAVAAGAGPVSPPPDCARVTVRLPVSIVQRDGPSRVQVKTSTPPDRSGWTDAWLPEKQP